MKELNNWLLANPLPKGLTTGDQLMDRYKSYEPLIHKAANEYTTLTEDNRVLYNNMYPLAAKEMGHTTS